MDKIKIGVLTGGGDAPGLNSAVKWVVKSALDSLLDDGNTYDVYGILDGFGGLINVNPTIGEDISQHIMPLSDIVVRTWDRSGGTKLGTARKNPYEKGNDTSEKVKDNIYRLGLDVIVVIGGEDTLGVANKLSKDGINVVGIPKTIDRDLSGTDYTLGFETAVDYIVESVDRLRTTAGSHSRVFVVETMGRHAGWLALEGGKAAGAYIILIPEYKFSMNKVNTLIKEGKKKGFRYEIVVVSEGAQPIGRRLVTKTGEKDAFGHEVLGGIGGYVANQISQGTGYDTRSIVLSHLQRGGVPCAFDRRMGRDFGIAAVDLIRQERFGYMVSYQNGRITSVPLEDAVRKLSLVDIKKDYDGQRLNGPRTIL